MNFSMDLALIILTAKLCGLSYSMRRAAPAALLGALWALSASIYPPLGSPPASVAVSAAMPLIVFGAKAAAIRAYLVFLALGAAFAGLGSVSGGASPALLVLSFAAAYFVYSLVFRALPAGKLKGGEYRCRISRGRRSATFTALADSGNTLRDPLRDLPVAVCPVSAVEPLFDRETIAVLRSFGAVEAVERLRGFTLIPYKSVGGEGMLAAFIPESVTVNGKPVRCAIAVDSACESAICPVLEVPNEAK